MPSQGSCSFKLDATFDNTSELAAAAHLLRAVRLTSNVLALAGRRLPEGLTVSELTALASDVAGAAAAFAGRSTSSSPNRTREWRPMRNLDASCMAISTCRLGESVFMAGQTSGDARSMRSFRALLCRNSDLKVRSRLEATRQTLKTSRAKSNRRWERLPLPDSNQALALTGVAGFFLDLNCGIPGECNLPMTTKWWSRAVTSTRRGTWSIGPHGQWERADR